MDRVNMDRAEFLRAEARACREALEGCADVRERSGLMSLANHYEREARFAEREQPQQEWQPRRLHS